MRSSRASLLLLAACGGATPAPAPPVPATQPAATQPAAAATRTLRYVSISNGKQRGAGQITIAADGSRSESFEWHDRGRGSAISSEIKLDADGNPVAMHSQGHDYWGAPVDEQLRVEGNELVWHSAKDEGRAPAGAGFYYAAHGPLDLQARLVARLTKLPPGQHVPLLPAGEAWVEEQSTLEVTIAGQPRKLQRVVLAGLSMEPDVIWLDEQGEYFADVSTWGSTIAEGAEAVVPELLAVGDKWHDARAARLAAELAQKPPAAGLVIQHARLFDSERRKVVQKDATVVIVGDRITAVGDARTKVPAGAQVVDAHGRMLLPGLWNMHQHLGDMSGVLDLATGITTTRDMGNAVDDLDARVARYEAGSELGPRVLRALLVDGRGAFAAPIGALADTPEEAEEVVARFAERHYQQVKIYSSVKPELVPVLVKAAHAHGMRVSGHIPSGMNATQAVEAGYDEIQHANFLFLNFLARADEDTRGPLRFSRVAEKGAALDLASPEVKRFLDLLVAHKTVLDPTLVTFEGMFGSDPGELDPDYQPYAGRLPALTERGMRNGGLAAHGDQRATFRASHAAMGKLVKLAWDRGIRIVAGTDRYPDVGLARELELYVIIGIAPADVLYIATLGAARVMGLDKVSGSIAVGKHADVILVDGDPLHDMGDLRKVDLVVCRGVMYDPAKLLPTVSIKPR